MHRRTRTNNAIAYEDFEYMVGKFKFNVTYRRKLITCMEMVCCSFVEHPRFPIANISILFSSETVWHGYAYNPCLLTIEAFKEKIKKDTQVIYNGVLPYTEEEIREVYNYTINKLIRTNGV